MPVQWRDEACPAGSRAFGVWNPITHGLGHSCTGGSNSGFLQRGDTFETFCSELFLIDTQVMMQIQAPVYW